jgi:hypothetical protein
MNLKIGANVRGAVRGLRQVSKQSKKTGAGMGALAVKAGAAVLAYKALDAAGRLLIGSFKQAGVELAVLGDRLAKQARMVGVTAEQYQVFEFAAKRAGTSVQHVSNGLKKLGRVMVDARNGSRQIKETFEALDIELMKSDGTLRDVNDVFLDLANRFAAMGPSAERTGSMMLLLGRSGTEMANMMAGGSKGITDMKSVLEDLDAVMSEDVLASSESLVDAQADLEHAFRGLKIEMGRELIPALVSAATALTNFLVALDGRAISDFLIKVLDLAEGLLLVSQAFFGIQKQSGKTFSNTLVGDMRQVEVQIQATEDRISSLDDALLEMQAGMGFKEALKSVGLYSDSIKSAKDATAALNEALSRANRNLKTQEKAYGALRSEHRKHVEGQGKELFDGKKLRQNIAALAGNRKKDTKATEGQTDAAKELLRWIKAQNKEMEGLQNALYETFYKTPETELTERWSREHDTISKALRLGGLEYEESLRLRAVADKEYSDGKIKLIQESAAKQADIEREAMERSLDTAGQVTQSFSSLFSSLSELAMLAYERGDEEAKKHAVALFHISQAFALATATVNTARAVSEALAVPPVPNIPLGIAAGVAGAAEIATIVGTSIQGIGDAGLTGDVLRKAGLNNHSAIVMRNDETLVDPVGTKHITEMLAIQKAQMQGGGGEQTIRTTVELDGRVLGESVDTYLVRQQERGLAYGNRVRQEYV